MTTIRGIVVRSLTAAACQTTDTITDLVAEKYNLDKSLMTLIHVVVAALRPNRAHALCRVRS